METPILETFLDIPLNRFLLVDLLFCGLFSESDYEWDSPARPRRSTSPRSRNSSDHGKKLVANCDRSDGQAAGAAGHDAPKVPEGGGRSFCLC